MRSLVTERCEELRSIFPHIGPIDGNVRWLRVRTPNYDSLIYSILYAARVEFRRKSIDKAKTVDDFISSINEKLDGNKLSTPSKPNNEALRIISSHLDVSITIIEKNASEWNFRVYGRDNKHIFIVRTDRVHYEPVAIYDNESDSYKFILME